MSYLRRFFTRSPFSQYVILHPRSQTAPLCVLLDKTSDKSQNSGLKYIFMLAAGYLTYKLCKQGDISPTRAFAASLSNRRNQFNFVADVVEKSAPSVVYIEIKDTRRFDFFTGKAQTVSNGSGFIIKSDGLILTNAHVVTHRAHAKVEVRLHNGNTYQGIVEDVDMVSDLATVRISAKNLPVINLGTSSDLRAGEFVVAMGSPLSLSNTVTFGVISATHRGSDELGITNKNMEYLQTDAAITFGNSGGPLINLDGDAIGINSMKVTTGISFAIPSDYVKKFLKSTEGIKKTGKPDKLQRRYMGITMLTLTPQILTELRQRNQYVPPDITSGVLVWKVILQSPAHVGGLHPGDIVTHMDGKPVTGANDVYALLSESSANVVTMTVIRFGQKLEVYIKPETID